MRPGPSGPPQPGREPEPIDWRDARTMIEFVERKWVLPTIAALIAGPRRKSELLRAIPGLSDKVLTDTLRRMRRDKLLTREVLDSEATVVAYALTPLGTSLLAPLAAMSRWTGENRQHLPPPRGGPRLRKAP